MVVEVVVGWRNSKKDEGLQPSDVARCAVVTIYSIWLDSKSRSYHRMNMIMCTSLIWLYEEEKMEAG